MGLLTPQEPHNHPQTPAQQILMSAADRWGLLGLLAMIKSAGSEVDGGLSSVGTDLGTMGLDVGYSGNLYSTFITPWADQSAAHTVEPDFHLPACYNVQTPAPGPGKAAAFSDETLFFMFYSSPRDALQEVAAQELFNRNWRYHKELRQWITKETGTPPSQKVQGGEQGTYTFWDPENWLKERKEMTVLYADLEEKNGNGLVPPHTAQPQNQTLGQGQIQQQQRGTFQMGMTGL
jgi:CCR4-NOT transcription complex subunit 2